METGKTEEEMVSDTHSEMEKLGLKPAEAEVEAPPETIPEVEPEPEAPAPKTEDKPDPSKAADREPEPTPKDYKQFKVDLRKELQDDFDKKLEAAKAEWAKAKPDESKAEILEDDIQALAKELEFDPEKTKKLIEFARRGIETLSPEDKKALEDLKTDRATRAQEAEEREQTAQFEKEWTEVLPSLQKEFPNASPEQIAAAKAQLDELAHSEKYAETDLDYVLFKEKEAIGKVLFSPRRATFESARPASVVETDTDEWPEITANMNPNQVAAAEKRRGEIVDGLPKAKVQVRTRDDRGNVIEREE